MKISTLQENLKSGLSVTSHVAGRNVNLPILNNIMIDARDGNIRLITTDLEIGITTMVRGKVEEEGVFTVDSKIISEFVGLLPNQKVDINKKDQRLLVKCENYKTAINGQSAEDFPLIPQVEKKIYYKATVDEFRKALSQVIFAVSTSETRMELSGVYFDFSDSELTLASTDSYRLAEKKVKIETNAAENTSTIVPARTLQEIIRILSVVKNENLSSTDARITFYLSENQIMFTVGGTEMVSRLIEGQYPDYKQIIPEEIKSEAVVDRSELIRAIKAASIFSKSGINDVNLDFMQDKGKVIVTSTSSQTGENTTDLSASVTGQDNGIVVNFRYLLDGLNNIDTDEVTLKVVNSNTPCIICPGGKEDKNNGDYLYIVMPIKQ